LRRHERPRVKGPIPQQSPQPYAPSVYEWGLSVGRIAATIFLYGWAVRRMPILQKAEQAQHG
jgi:formate dehydrogenase iron-sulfur subunit